MEVLTSCPMKESTRRSGFQAKVLMVPRKCSKVGRSFSDAVHPRAEQFCLGWGLGWCRHCPRKNGQQLLSCALAMVWKDPLTGLRTPLRILSLLAILNELFGLNIANSWTARWAARALQLSIKYQVSVENCYYQRGLVPFSDLSVSIA